MTQGKKDEVRDILTIIGLCLSFEYFPNLEQSRMDDSGTFESIVLIIEAMFLVSWRRRACLFVPLSPQRQGC